MVEHMNEMIQNRRYACIQDRDSRNVILKLISNHEINQSMVLVTSCFKYQHATTPRIFICCLIEFKKKYPLCTTLKHKLNQCPIRSLIWNGFQNCFERKHTSATSSAPGRALMSYLD